MAMKRPCSLLASLLVGLLLVLAGCGVTSSPSGAGSSARASGTPDSVRIAIDQVVGAQPVVTLTDVKLARQLYATLLALPPEPPDQACPADLGPHYTLTFRQGSKTLAAVLARRDGCWPVTIAGEAPDRHASQAFWTQLDQAIYVATPPARPAALAIQYTPDPTHVPQTARIPSAAVAQRLYDAILTLTRAPWDPGCADTAVPRYQFVFQAPNQLVPALMHDACNTIELNTIGLQGDSRTRSGVFVMDDQFKQLFQQIIGEATFAPASPDHLTLTIERMLTSEHSKTINAAALTQRLFQETFRLAPMHPQPPCPTEADKSAGVGTWYMFSFSQWGLPVLQVQAYEGSCTLVELVYTSSQQVVQGDQTFWNLVHQAAALV